MLQLRQNFQLACFYYNLTIFKITQLLSPSTFLTTNKRPSISTSSTTPEDPLPSQLITLPQLASLFLLFYELIIISLDHRMTNLQQTIVMNEIDVMEENLGKLMKEHYSLDQDQSEPADPFRKRQFGKKMKKSTATLLEQSHVQQNHLQIKEKNILPILIRPKQSCESMEYESQTEKIMGKLRKKIDEVQWQVKERLRKLGKEKEKQKMEEVVGWLQGSIQFIMRDCLKLQEQQKKMVIEKRLDNRHNKENYKQESNLPRRQKEGQKSIYESILQERKMKKSKRKML